MALGATLVVVLGAWNIVVVPRFPARPGAYVAANGAATAVLLAAARAAGLAWADLGLDRRRLAAGAREGGVCAAVVASGYAVALAVPGARPLLADARVAGLDGRGIAGQVLVRVPLGTVLWEEVAFRGALPAVLARLVSPRRAAGASAALFGIWHVRPTLDALAVNGLATRPRERVAAVLLACLSTAAAGLLFAQLRRHSGSLLAPALLHLAANSLGILAAAAAHRLR
ncbi:CPBP family intramembrane glutamic endopeptidase [Geodermatophilus sabuli]|uniref:CAAX protease self-immunity n=2 Tax=Geodermatophilus sabuli TaxID=1564158 RepID=A0A285EHD0_9ACTN|nr:CPBP family intramembrane glutamic endopeptidase [Geodermatophilus sabuli]MBB3083877.1 membrane protease YdiL (CAAX protease family) [Geodermatophilus sabuli]SNX98528.1 CAAX protease self-immunity [Geodermatophilus sabuli]